MTNCKFDVLVLPRRFRDCGSLSTETLGGLAALLQAQAIKDDVLVVDIRHVDFAGAGFVGVLAATATKRALRVRNAKRGVSAVLCVCGFRHLLVSARTHVGQTLPLGFLPYVRSSDELTA